MRKSIILLLFSAISVILLAGRADAIKIKYLTGENVYLDAGTADSLKVGDHLIVMRGDQAMAELEVVFAAEHSASCHVVNQNMPIAIGDDIQIVAREIPPLPVESKPEPEPAPVPESKPQAVQAAYAAKPGTPAVRFSGSLSFQFHHWDDTNPTNLDFSQPGSRLNLRASNLWGRNLNLKIRGTARQDRRSKEYGPNVPKNEWRNRVYQASLAYGNEQSQFYFIAGRIITSKLSGIGYIDGALIQKSLSSNFQIGGFGGTQPDWQSSGFQTSLQKYGAYLGYSVGEIGNRRLETVLAGAGEYHNGTVSREFLFTRNNVTIGNRWSFFQSAEFDINRDWRKEKTGRSFALSNLYLSARGRLSEKITAGLSYDNRKNYWTYELKTLADSLFDDVLRQGLRADLSLRPARTLFLYSNVGYRQRAGDSQATYSYSLGVNKNGLLGASRYVNIQGAGFAGPFTNGFNYSARIGQYFGNGQMISVAYGAYIYEYKAGQISRHNDWAQVSGQFNIIRQIFASGSYEVNMGDDSRGRRFIAELGYRF